MNNLVVKIFNKLYSLTWAKLKRRSTYNDFFFFVLWKLRFKLACIKPIDKNLILFVADGSRSMPNEYKSLFDLAKSNGYKCIILYHFKDGSKFAFINELSKICSELKFQKYYARAKSVFLYDYYLPAYANNPRKGTKLIQIWHACGAFKKWGYSTKNSNWGLSASKLERYNVHQTYTDVITSSAYIADKYAEAFNVSQDIVSPLGVPRSDIFFNRDFTEKQKEYLTEKYPNIKNKKIILWAPTHRGTSLYNSYNDKAIDFVRLKHLFGDDSVLLMKLHPRLANPIEFTAEEKNELQDFLIDISKEITIETALCSADIVITDYSSLIFEFSLFNRPMIFYAYDLDEYDSERSFYYDYRSFVPGKIAQNTDELIEAIKNADTDFDINKLNQFKDKFMSGCDGHATEKIFNEFIKK